MKRTLQMIGCGILLVLLVGAFVVMSAQHTEKEATKVLRIGFIGTLSGDTAYYGESTLEGVRVALDAFTKQNPDVKVELYVEDSFFTAKGGIDAYHKLRDVHAIDAVITQASNVGVAVQPLALEDGVLQMSALVLASGYSTPNDLSYRVTANATLEAQAIAAYLAEQGATRVGFIGMQNEIGTSLHTELEQSLTEATGTGLVAAEFFAPDQTDMRTQLLKVKEANVDFVYVAGTSAHAALVLKQMRDVGITVPVVGYRGFHDPLLYANAGALAEGVVFPSTYNAAAAREENKIFRTLFAEAYQREPGDFQAEGYEAMRIVLQVLVSCGADDACAQDMLDTTVFATVFGQLTFDDNGDVAYPLTLKTFTDGVIDDKVR